MTEQYLPNLGHEPPEGARRDAVHVAVAPVVAGEELFPGFGIRLDENGQAVSAGGKDVIGVVDPFLHREVKAGQRFWLFLRPGTVTSLRHVWSHPAFRANVPGVP